MTDYDLEVDVMKFRTPREAIVYYRNLACAAAFDAGMAQAERDELRALTDRRRLAFTTGQLAAEMTTERDALRAQVAKLRDVLIYLHREQGVLPCAHGYGPLVDQVLDETEPKHG